ncbi:MAG: hypothetical protein ACK5KQ_05855 [Anaerorhabdus sp.]
MKVNKKYIGISICFGILFGIAFDNLALGIALGAIYVAVVYYINKDK